MLGVTYTKVNRHITEARAELPELRDAAQDAFKSAGTSRRPRTGRRGLQSRPVGFGFADGSARATVARR